MSEAEQALPRSPNEALMSERKATGAAAKKRESGANIPEGQRSTVQLKLRVSPATVDALDALRGDSPRSEFVAAIIEATRASKRKR